jgi:protein-L-isoaspartate(D-aspartate) O-methyltransferase
MDDPSAARRQRMVEQQLRSRGIADEAVLRAMARVPRERFVEEGMRGSAYVDGPLPIGRGQTISQPYIVAYMTERLELSGREAVLEIGTGSGYQAAVLAETAARVYTVERIPELSAAARALLEEELGYRNVSFRVGRGQEGWAEFAPFERIVLTAAAEEFPAALFGQLAEGGIALAPLGADGQRLVRFRKRPGRIDAEELIGVVFVPLL